MPEFTFSLSPLSRPGQYAVHLNQGDTSVDLAPESTLQLPQTWFRRARALIQAPIVGMTPWRWRRPAEAWEPIREVEDLGHRLWRRLPRRLRALLTELRRCRNVRLILRLPPGDPVALLPWEALRDQNGDPVVQEGWEVVRVLESLRTPKPFVGGRFRLLLLVGALDQHPRCRPAEFDVWREVLAIELGVRTLDLDLTIATDRATLARIEGDLGFRPYVIENQAELVALLRLGWHAVHFVGHGNGHSEPSDALCFPFTTASAQTLVAALRGTHTRLAVLNACQARELLAAPLLSVVDHVVGMAAQVPSALGPVWVRAFYQALIPVDRPTSVGAALAAARTAVRAQSGFSYLDWLPLHWTQVAPHATFADPATMALASYRSGLALRNRNPIQLPGVEPVPLRVLACNPEAGPVTALVLDLFRLGRRWALCGPTGLGKTCSVRCLTRDLASRGELTPVPIQATDWAGSRWNGDGSLAGLLRFANQGAGVAAPDELLVQSQLEAARSGRLVLLVDGLEELAPDAYCRLSESLAVAAMEFPELSLLVTTRTWPIAPLLDPALGFRQAHLLPPTWVERTGFLARLLARRRQDPDEAESLARAAIAQVRTSVGLAALTDTLCALPWLAACIADGTAPLPDQLDAFSRQLVVKLLQGSHRAGTTAVEQPDDALRVLQALAFDMTEQLGSRFRLRVLVEYLQRRAPRAIRQWFTGPRPRWGGAAAFLRSVMASGLLCCDGEPELAPWRFAHRGLQEVLAARELAATSRGQVASVLRLCERLRTCGGDAATLFQFWSEPLVHLARMARTRPDRWLRRLLASPITTGLAVRALHAAPRAGFAVAREALRKCLNPRQRQDVLTGFGVRYARHRDATRLLVEQAREHSSARELWWFGEALARIGASESFRRILRALRPQRGAETSAPDPWQPVPGTGLAASGEVTLAQFRWFDPRQEECDAQSQVVACCWSAAKTFSAWVSVQAGCEVALPTVALALPATAAALHYWCEDLWPASHGEPAYGFRALKTSSGELDASDPELAWPLVGLRLVADARAAQALHRFFSHPPGSEAAAH